MFFVCGTYCFRNMVAKYSQICNRYPDSAIIYFPEMSPQKNVNIWPKSLLSLSCPKVLAMGFFKKWYEYLSHNAY